ERIKKIFIQYQKEKQKIKEMEWKKKEEERQEKIKQQKIQKEQEKERIRNQKVKEYYENMSKIIINKEEERKFNFWEKEYIAIREKKNKRARGRQIKEQKKILEKNLTSILIKREQQKIWESKINEEKEKKKLEEENKLEEVRKKMEEEK